jgi:hypothetical protein
MRIYSSALSIGSGFPIIHCRVSRIDFSQKFRVMYQIQARNVHFRIESQTAKKQRATEQKNGSGHIRERTGEIQGISFGQIIVFFLVMLSEM